MTKEAVAERGKRKVSSVFKIGQIVCVYADGIHYYEQVVFADWCGREFVYLTSGGHTSNLFNVRALTKLERGA